MVMAWGDGAASAITPSLKNRHLYPFSDKSFEGSAMMFVFAFLGALARILSALFTGIMSASLDFDYHSLLPGSPCRYCCRGIDDRSNQGIRQLHCAIRMCDSALLGRRLSFSSCGRSTPHGCERCFHIRTDLFSCTVEFLGTVGIHSRGGYQRRTGHAMKSGRHPRLR